MFFVQPMGGSGFSRRLDQVPFSAVATIVNASLVPAALETVNADMSADVFTRLTDGVQMPVVSFGGGLMTVQNNSGTNRVTFFQVGPDLQIPQFAAQIDVVSRTPAASGGDFTSVGIIKDANNSIFASYDKVGNSLFILVRISGVLTFNASVALNHTAPFKLGFSLVGNMACAYTDTGAGMTFRTGYDLVSKIDFKTGSMAGWRASFGCFSAANATWVLDNFKAGSFGGFGWRDFVVVTTPDGMPYMPGGLLHFTATILDGRGIGSAGVFTIDTSTYAINQLAVFMLDRGGSKQNDLSAHIINNLDGTFKLVISSWGNGFGNAIDTWYGTTSINLLSGSRLVTGMAKLTLPYQSAGYAAYDAMLVQIGSEWRLTYTISESTSFTGSPFYPALATSTDLINWTGVRRDSTARPYEGSKWVKVDDRLYSTSGGSTTSRVYDDTLNFLGNLQATFNGGGVTFPHAAIAQMGGKLMMLTFDQVKPAGNTNAFTWGRMIVHEGSVY